MHRAPEVAIIHERFTELGGSERVVAQLRTIWPDAAVYGAVVDPEPFPADLVSGIRTTRLQHLYRGGSRYAHLLPLLPAAMSRLDVGRPDVVVTSHHAFSNRVRPPRGVPMIAYVHTPARWIWEPAMLAHEGRGQVATAALRGFARTQRAPDRAAARRLDLVIANSNHVAERIRRHWQVDSTVLNPPVDIDFFTPDPQVPREDFFLLAGRLVPYKQPEVAVAAARRCGARLVVAGDGRSLAAVKARSGPNVEILGGVSDEQLRDLMRRCKALVFPGEEDFGLVPVEAQACGTPVIARSVGGVLDSVVDGVTGTLYREPGAEGLAEAMCTFDRHQFDADRVRRHAESFSPRAFRRRFEAIVQQTL